MAEFRSLKRTPEPPKLSDKEWSFIAEVLVPCQGRRPDAQLRRNLEGIRWVAWSGRPWSCMPAVYGKADTVRRYYVRIQKSGMLSKLLSHFPAKRIFIPSKYKADESVIRQQVHQQLEFINDLAERIRKCQTTNKQEVVR